LHRPSRDNMDLEKLKNALRGVSVTTVTPFSEDLKEISQSALEGNLKYLRDHGVTYVVPCGNTGEYYSLSESEWRQVVDITLASVGSKMVVMPGVGSSLGTAIDQMKHAESAGADMVMVMYPQHVFRSEEGLLRYYRDILDAAEGIGVVLYKKGPLLTDAILSRLAGHRHLVGAKYAFGRIVDFARAVQVVGDQVVWSCGTAERFTPFFWLAGARGFTTGLGNFAPKVSLMMFEALKSGDYSEAMRIQHMISELEFLREGREMANNVPVVKAALDHVGLRGGPCRPPLHSLNEAEKTAVVQAIESWPL
jgi:4-hydroxy-tetrahydrodipicolinate synthase